MLIKAILCLQSFDLFKSAVQLEIGNELFQRFWLWFIVCDAWYYFLSLLKLELIFDILQKFLFCADIALCKRWKFATWWWINGDVKFSFDIVIVMLEFFIIVAKHGVWWSRFCKKRNIDSKFIVFLQMIELLFARRSFEILNKTFSPIRFDNYFDIPNLNFHNFILDEVFSPLKSSLMIAPLLSSSSLCLWWRERFMQWITQGSWQKEQF